MLYTPLEQFSIVRLIPLKFGNFDISFTNSSLYLLGSTGLVFLLFCCDLFLVYFFAFFFCLLYLVDFFLFL